MDTILEVFFLPPMAVGRLGGSTTPLEAFTWETDVASHGGNRTVIRPATSFYVEEDGSIRPYLPTSIRFKDGGKIRPVAPFFELWTKIQRVDGKTVEIVEEPLTTRLLGSVGASIRNVRYVVTAGNRKAQRRTGSATCAFLARVTLEATDHTPKPLRAVSPHTSGQEPLVYPDKPISLGSFQALRPVRLEESGVNLDILRVRFTPAKGEVYGPPTATQGPASPLQPGGALPAITEGGRIHMIVAPENRILNPNTPWSRYVMDNQGQQDPQPSDSYDGANVGDNVSWGVVDDSCDALIEAQVVIAGVRHVATARVLVGPPDYAPDRRPFVSFVDDLADRDLPPPVVNDSTYDATVENMTDLFKRIFEVAAGMNLDGTRYHAIGENSGPPPATNYPGLPQVDNRTMTAEDKPYAKVVPEFTIPKKPGDETGGVAHDRLPYTAVVPIAHAPLSDVETLLDFLRTNAERVRMLVRPPFGRFREMLDEPGPVPSPTHRDPRVARDGVQDMRMPPYMRDSDETPLSLTHRQYAELMGLLDYFNKPEVMALVDSAAPGLHPQSPLTRRVAHLVARLEGSKPGSSSSSSRKGN
ncbi:MAG TPA: hypothetical protein PK156_04225 [Polyangium sp.]|nr:hypothetical protein [Polyangium sp.]